MSRIYKFRAWDKQTKQMMTGAADMQSLVARALLINLGFRDTHNEVSEDALGWFEFMQYTGLKDKNGVEIYEGDIITTSNKTSKEVKWIELNRTGHIGFNLDSRANYEVIGNIYENKELVK